MKNLSSFEAFKLNKAQMGAIAGGTIYCYVSDTAKEAYFEATTMDEAQAGAGRAFGETATCEELAKA